MGSIGDYFTLGDEGELRVVAAGPASIASVRRVLMQSWSSAVEDVTAASGIQVPRGEWERVWGPVGTIVTPAVGSRQSEGGARSVRSGRSARSAAETGNLACGATQSLPFRRRRQPDRPSACSVTRFPEPCGQPIVRVRLELALNPCAGFPDWLLGVTCAGYAARQAD